MSANSIYEDIDSRSLIDLEDEASDADSLLQHDSIDNGPSVAQQTAKALDAAEDGMSIPDDEEGLPPLASSPANRVWLEGIPVRDAGPAPPDYAAATAWRKALQSRQNRQHSTELDEELYGEIQLPPDTSRGRIPPDYTDGTTDNAITFRRTIPTKGASRKRRWRYVIWIISMYCAVTLIFSIPWLVRSRNGENIRRIAKKDHPAALDDFCRYETFSDYAVYKFDKLTYDFFEFSYESYPEEYPDITFERKLNFHVGPPEQTAAIEVWMNVATAKPYRVAKFSALEEPRAIYIRDPLLIHSNYPDTKPGKLLSRRKQSCASVWMAIFIRPDAVPWLRVQTDRVSISLGHGDQQWKQHLQNMTIPSLELWTSTGNVEAGYLDTHYLEIYTETGRISGTYTLGESADFTGDSGKLDVTMVPRKCKESVTSCRNFTIQGQLDPDGVHHPKVDPDDVLGPGSDLKFTPGKEEWWFDENHRREDKEFSGRLRVHRKGDRFKNIYGDEEEYHSDV